MNIFAANIDGFKFIMQCLAFVVVLGLDEINALNSLSCSVNNFFVILRLSSKL